VTLAFKDDVRGDCHTLSLAGELDVATAPELQAAIVRLCEEGAREIVLDLHELSFIDSSGLRLISTSPQVCAGHGCDFSLTRAQAPVQHLFDLTGVTGRLSFRGKAFAKRIARRQPFATRVPPNRFPPGFEVSLDLNRDAPRSARNYVRDLLGAYGSDDVRNAVMLLTSELVTPIVERSTAAELDIGELRVWLRDDVARVELRVPSVLLRQPPEHRGPRYDRILFDELADRWSIDDAEHTTCIWFEIDSSESPRESRHPASVSEGARSNGRSPEAAK